MSRQVDQGLYPGEGSYPGEGFASTPGEVAKSPPPGGENMSLEQLLTSARDLYAETTAHFRDIGELAFMEFEQAVKSLKMGLVALLLLSMCSVLACVFLIVAIVLAIANSSTSPAMLLFLCGVISVIAAGALYLFLRSLTNKMTFSNLRNQLTQERKKANERP